LMTQDDIQINASPSVVAINQTPATIAIVEEISINTGIYNVETAKGVTLERAFTRAQYGITIDITPTIHITDEEDEAEGEPSYVTLDTDITFDTIQPGIDIERPDVTRRHVNNQVRVPDGQTL
jgi:general secretion pathway protein D